MFGELTFSPFLALDGIGILILSLAICVLISVVLSCLYCIFLLSRVKNDLLGQLKKLETNMHVINSSTLGMGQKILSIEKNIHLIKANQEELKTSDFDVSYSTAEKLISQGADDRAIAANVSLSASEINLMRLLHGTDTKACNLQNHVPHFEPQNASEALLAQKIREYQQNLAVHN